MAMIEPENRLFWLLDDGMALVREQQRLKALSDLGLLEAETIPVFEEATQTTAHFLSAPICILGFLDQNRLRVRSAVGLSRIGLMNQLAQERQLPRDESFCTHVVQTHQVLAISDALSDPNFANSVLVQLYGIRAYLGVPLMNAFGHCLGAIAVMDRSPRTFTIRDIEFLELMARWSMSEFERNWLLKLQDHGNKGAVSEQEKEFYPRQFTGAEEPPHNPGVPLPTPVHGSGGTPAPPWLLCSSPSPAPLPANQVKLELLTQLTHELRTPLTSVLGMANVVGREIYGPLTSKQKEYLEIIQHSGRYLLSLVNEISELGTLDDSTLKLNLTSVDIEMLCQQVINTLEEVANRREQKISLSVEPGRSRSWILDKDKVRQLLYHLVFSVIQTANTGSIIRIHVSHKSDGLNLAVGVSHPWLGEGLTQVAHPYFYQSPVSVVSDQSDSVSDNTHSQRPESPLLPTPNTQPLDLSLTNSGVPIVQTTEANSFNRSHESLRLLLSYHLAKLHNGKILIHGTPESGYRYVVSLPEQEAVEESL